MDYLYIIQIISEKYELIMNHNNVVHGTAKVMPPVTPGVGDSNDFEMNKTPVTKTQISVSIILALLVAVFLFGNFQKKAP